LKLSYLSWHHILPLATDPASATDLGKFKVRIFQTVAEACDNALLTCKI
jgi:hypothetical protein